MHISLSCQKHFNAMNIENTKAQMRKGILEFCILSIIASDEEVYASEILERMKKAQLIVVEGTLYPLLTRLKNDGYLSYQWVESKSGPPRKYYKLTVLGEQFLNELRKTWQELVDAIQLATQKPLESVSDQDHSNPNISNNQTEANQ
jgi:PadR family transcriptional regulator, regulatory protein PadR